MNIRLKTRFFTAMKTQREVAIKIGIPETRMSEFIQSVREPTAEQKKAIARELYCEIVEIF